MIVYRYGLQFRPLGPGTSPKGFILPYDPSARTTRSTPDWDNHLARHGYIEYVAPLSEDDRYAFELNYLGEFDIEVSEAYGSTYRHTPA